MSLFETLVERVERAPDEVWVRWGDATVTWAGALDLSLRAAGSLRADGLAAGDRVALISGNRPGFLWAYLGASFLGATVVPVNPRQSPVVLDHILGDCEPRLVRREDDLDALATGSPLERDAVAPSAGETIMYTSGTTGPPKGVLVHGAVGAARPAVFDVGGITAADTLYCCLPLFHGNALFVSALGSLAVGARLALAPRFTASGHWDQCRAAGATQFNAIGAMIPFLLKQPPSPADRDHDVRVVFSSGCPAEQWGAFEERFGVELVEWFGIVDYPGNLVNVDRVVGAIGRPAGTDARIVGDDGEVLGPEQVGELQLRSERGATREYFRDPEATRASRPDGWFRTGDLARRDADGVYFHHGRQKDSIRRRGENISPWEVESVVGADDRVRAVAAFAVPSEVGEDEVMVAVVPAGPDAITPAEVVALARAGLAAHAVPRFVDLVDEIPTTETAKVMYAALRQRGRTATTWDRDAAPVPSGGGPRVH